MAAQFSFDVVSNFDMQEVKNAIQQATKEIDQRFDFKGSKTQITLEDQEIIVHSDDDYKLKAVVEILQGKFIKRGISPKFMTFGAVEDSLGGTKKQKIALQQGIPQEKAKEISKAVRDSKLKAQVQIQGDQLRVAGKSKDDLQEVITLLKGKDFGIALQFTNYR
jgi:cyclic-di-GMP-binding protein